MKRMMKSGISFLIAVILVVCSSAVCSFADEPVSLTAASAVLMDAKTMQVLYEKKPHESCYPASVTKIMTLLLVMEAIDSGKISLEDTVVCSPDAAAKGGSQIWLREGESMSVDELLRAACIASANDACCALAELVAGSEQAFVKLMNEKVQSLGMKETHFDNCSGLDDDTETHLTSAYDVAVMSAQLLRHEKIKEYSTRWMDSLRDGATQLVNTNRLVRFYEGATGLKTGTTSKAGCCISASAERNGMHLIAVIMGAKTSNERFEDAKKLLNYGFAGFQCITPGVGQDEIPDVRVIKGKQRYVKAVLDSVAPVTIKKENADKLTYKINMAEDLYAPVEKGQKLGEAVFYSGKKEICRADIKALCAVEKKSIAYIVCRIIKSYCAYDFTSKTY
ncbi:MAG: D-alanyl-D-alanine carboxypeptidase [Clostridia bacterium]|nr:D-alanyl-D-alanine carboxypeptidase [Clostridia bacterium]